MDVKFLDLTRQYEILKKELEPAILRCAMNGNYIGGSVVQEFEDSFAKYIGVKYAVAVNSGTDALAIALRAIGISEGDEVITTPFTFFATAEAIVSVKAIPVFVDVEESTYNIDVNAIEEKISSRTKAILPVHIFGQPANMDEINKIAVKYNLKVIEDACQAAGAAIYGKRAGGLGTIGCFSFFPTKNLGAFGDGGMITTNEENLAVIARAIREHGSGVNGAKAYKLFGYEYTDIGTVEKQTVLYTPHKYFNYIIGVNSRLDAIQAAVLSIKLKYLDEFNQKRNEIADRYYEGLNTLKEIILPECKEGIYHVRHQFVFRCEEKYKLIEYLGEHHVGAASFYPIPLHLQKALSYLGYKEGDLPVAEKITKETVCIPIYPELKKEEQEYVLRTIYAFYQH